MQSPRVMILRSPPVDTSGRKIVKARRKVAPRKLVFEENLNETNTTEDQRSTLDTKQTQESVPEKQTLERLIIEDYFAN
jgi:hypothetical protein